MSYISRTFFGGVNHFSTTTSSLFIWCWSQSSPEKNTAKNDISPKHMWDFLWSYSAQNISPPFKSLSLQKFLGPSAQPFWTHLGYPQIIQVRPKIGLKQAWFQHGIPHDLRHPSLHSQASINSLSSVAICSCSSCSTAVSRITGFPRPVDSQLPSHGQIQWLKYVKIVRRWVYHGLSWFISVLIMGINN